MSTKISRLERRRIFGQPGKKGTVRHRIVKAILPFELPMALGLAGKYQTVWAHRLIKAHLERAIVAAVAASGWQPARIDSYNARRIRFSLLWSFHAFCLGFDMFAEPYPITPPGGVWRPINHPPPAFVKVMKAYGFTWGGDWVRRDLAHFEWRRGIPTSADIPNSSPDRLQPKEGYVQITASFPILMRDDEGGAVRKMQGLLISHTPGDDRSRSQGFVDGVYGPRTEKVFKLWQKHRKLTIDGICGQNSWKALVDG